MVADPGLTRVNEIAVGGGRGAWRYSNAFGAHRRSRINDPVLVDLSATDPTRRHYKEILGFVRRRAGTAVDAEDITQEVFASAAEQLSRSAGMAPPTLGWLYTVARRRLVDEARQRRRAETVSLELVREPEADSQYGSSVATAFDAALTRLTEGQRVVVLLRLLEGRSFAEIARRVSATEEACRMRFMRGLEQLRTELEREGVSPS
jgi:RNA polymerase sigma factor (sigma-70 family)